MDDALNALSESKAFIMTIARRRSIAEASKEHLVAEGIAATITESIDGSIAGLETKWTYELDQPGAGYRIGPKPVAVCLGHYMIWYAADLMKRGPVAVFEDDVRMTQGWKGKVEFAAHSIPQDWDMLFLGSCSTVIDKREHIGNGVHRVKAALCSHAYILSSGGIPKLLKHCHQIWAPIDIAISIRALPNIKAYAILPRVAEQTNTQLDP